MLLNLLWKCTKFLQSNTNLVAKSPNKRRNYRKAAIFSLPGSTSGGSLEEAEVYRKTTVTNATISNAGQMKASIRTKLKKGSPVWACVYELVDAEADKWNEKSCKKAKVKKGGKASIKVKGVKDGNWVEVYDAKDRLLVAWGASGGS